MLGNEDTQVVTGGRTGRSRLDTRQMSPELYRARTERLTALCEALRAERQVCHTKDTDVLRALLSAYCDHIESLVPDTNHTTANFQE